MLLFPFRRRDHLDRSTAPSAGEDELGCIQTTRNLDDPTFKAQNARAG